MKTPESWKGGHSYFNEQGDFSISIRQVLGVSPAGRKRTVGPGQTHVCDGVNHGFHNDTTPCYDEEAAMLAQERTMAFFDHHLRE